MAQKQLGGCSILLVEDEYMIADHLQYALEKEGATVLGPVADISQALAALKGAPRVNAALLDVNLGGEPVYPLADVLIERGIPFVFTTGYDQRTIPSRYADIPRCEKPVHLPTVIRSIRRVLADAA